MSRNTRPGHRIGAPKRKGNQAHRDPSLSRIWAQPDWARTPANGVVHEWTTDPLEKSLLDQLEKVTASEPAPRDRIRTIDAIFAIAIVFLAAVWFVARILADAQCGMYHG